MRLVAWNCNMALHRKAAALASLRPDVAVVSECAAPDRIEARGGLPGLSDVPLWFGRNPNKGLGVFAFNGHRLRLAEPFFPTLRYIAPVEVEGPDPFRLLAVWAQNASGGLTRKHQSGPLRRGLTKYRGFLEGERVFVAGDLNNNVFWDRPGWRINHAKAVEGLARVGLTSAYHALRGEAQGEESVPTIYWRDRTVDGPTYHIDYIFLPRALLPRVTGFEIGSYAPWCGSGLSDHVPLVLDVAL